MGKRKPTGRPPALELALRAEIAWLYFYEHWSAPKIRALKRFSELSEGAIRGLAHRNRAAAKALRSEHPEWGGAES